jgi:hypothetical protein
MKIAGPTRDSNLDEIQINLNLNLNLILNLNLSLNLTTMLIGPDRQV